MLGRSLGGRPLGGWPRGLHRVGARASGGGGDPSLQLYYNYLLNSASTISQSVRKGPVPIKTIAGNAMSFDSSGNLAYAPHQLCENANLGTRTGDLPSGWAWTTETGSIAWTDPGTYSQGVFTVSTERQELVNAVTVVASTTYTAFAYIEESAITSGAATILAVTGTNGTDGDITDTDWDFLGGVAGWYAVGFTMGADTEIDLTIGAGVGGNAVGSVTMSRPGIIKGLIPDVGVNVPAKLSGEPLGRWLGTDDGDEPLYDQPRFAHNPADSNAQLGLLMEEARTNLCLQSEDLETSWTATNGGVSANAAVAPDGNTTADQFDADGGGSSYMQQTSKVTVTDSVPVAVSIFAKYIDNQWISLRFTDVTGTPRVSFDIQNGVKGTETGSITGSIEDVGGGWYKCSAVATSTATTIAVRFYLATSTSVLGTPASGKGAYLWGAQIEEGAFITSYIPTTTASVTRAKDVPPTTTDLSWFNENAGTMFVQATMPVITNSTSYLMEVDDGTSSDGFILWFDSDELINFDSINSGGDNGGVDGASAITAETVFKGIAAYAQDDVTTYTDGTVTAGPDSAADFPLGDSMVNMRLGQDESGGSSFNGHIQTVKFWNVRKANAFLDAETT